MSAATHSHTLVIIRPATKQSERVPRAQSKSRNALFYALTVALRLRFAGGMRALRDSL